MSRGSDEKSILMESVGINLLRTSSKKEERFVHRPGYWKPINDKVYATDQISAVDAEEATATPVYKLIRQKLRLTSEKTNLLSSSWPLISATRRVHNAHKFNRVPNKINEFISSNIE